MMENQPNQAAQKETPSEDFDLRWEMCKIDESSQASCLACPAIDPHYLDAARQEPECLAASAILVLYTGGTIGMRQVNGAYQPISNYLVRTLLKMPTFNDPYYAHPPQSRTRNCPKCETTQSIDTDQLISAQHTSNVTFVLPMTKDKRRIFYSIAEYSPLLDSSDMTMDDWVRIARDIHTYYSYFDGFVVLHGTDTMAYTASALSFMFEGLGKPVVVTGSQLPIFEFRSDGWNNFLGALLIAGGDHAISEVTVFFHDKLFRGNRVVKRSSSEFHAFDSPNYPALAKCGVDLEMFPSCFFRAIGPRHPFQVHTDLCRDVTVLNMFPSISHDHVATFLKPPTKGVVIRTYGAGNVPASRSDLLQLFRQASDRGILMMNVSQCYRGGVKAIYSTGMILNKYGVIPGYDITTEAALTKLAYVLGKKEFPDLASKRAMLLRNLRGELTIQGEDAQSARLLFQTDLVRRNGEQSLYDYFTSMFNADHKDYLDGRGYMWMRRLTPAMACIAASRNDLASLEEIYQIVGHLQFSDNDGCSPLHKAARHGHIQSTEFLLNHGVLVDQKDSWGMTALDHAITSTTAKAELIQLLRDAGASIALQDHQLSRSINAAAARGDIQRLHFFQLAGATLQEYDVEGRCPLHVAVANRQLTTVRYLLRPKQAADPTLINGLARHQSFDSSPHETDGYPSGAGVNPFLPTRWGTTASDEAKLRGFDELVELLQPYEAAITHKNAFRPTRVSI